MRQPIIFIPLLSNHITNKELDPQEKSTPMKLKNFQYYPVGDNNNYSFCMTMIEIQV